MSAMQKSDFIVIGAGIAGASVAAHLAAKASVVILEMEERPAYHTTGRSAAAYEPNSSPRPFIPLIRAGLDFFKNPPPDFADTPIYTSRGTLMIEPPGQEEEAKPLRAFSHMQVLNESEMQKLLPALRKGYAERGYYDATSGDLNVHLLHSGYLKWFKQRGGKLICNACATAITKAGEGWTVTTPQGTFSAPVIINAAGAWGDVVAQMAGVRGIGLQPKRRSIGVTPVTGYNKFMDWPFFMDCAELWYAKPQSGKLLVSSADQTPVDPHDAWADDEAIALGIERLTEATTLEVTHLDHKWGGLRTFARDKFPVCGFDPAVKNFFWLVGQGGNGIQSSLGLSRVAAAMALHEKLPEDVLALGLDVNDILPERLRT